MRKWMNLLYRLPVRSFQFRLLIYLLLFGSITLVCFIMAFFLQSSRYAQTEVESYINHAHEQTIERIGKEINQLTYISDNLAADFIIQQYLNSNNTNNSSLETEVKRYYDRILEINKKSSAYITDLCISFDEKGTSICPNTAIIQTDNELPSKTNEQEIQLFKSGSEPYDSLRYVAPVHVIGSNAIKGHIVIILDLNKMILDIQKINPLNKLTLVDEQGNLIYSSTGDKAPPPSMKSGRLDEFTETHADYITNQRKLKLLNVNWLSRMEVKSEFLTASWRSLQNTLLFFFTVFFIVSILSSILFSKFITKPLYTLRLLMKRAELGDLKAYWTSRSTQEINDLGESFNQMLNRIEDLIKQVKSEEALKKEAEIEALQYQLNPHFLYNTLNTIKWVAKIHKTPQISEVVSSLVRLLQVSLGKRGDFLTLRDEISLIKDYMEIQSFRYGDQVTMIYDIEDFAGLCLVPRMILQPLVENALIHGIEPSERKGIITIKAWIDRDLLICQVEDNGRGMPETAKPKDVSINNGLQEKMSGIGLKHIREKIKLYYGPDYKMHMIHKANQGTIIRMSLPIHPSEE